MMTKEEAIKKLEESGTYFREMTNFHDDKDVALVAVKKRGISLRYCSNRLKNDVDIVSEAIKQDIEALNFVSEEFMKDPRIIEIAKQNGLESFIQKIKYEEDRKLQKQREEEYKELEEKRVKMNLFNTKVTQFMDEVSEISKNFNLSQDEVLNIMKILELRELNENIKNVADKIDNME